jgi:membrane protein
MERETDLALKSRLMEKWSDLSVFFKARAERSSRWLDDFTARHGWAAVSVQAVKDFFRHDMTIHSGNFAYSSFLAIFPLILLITSIVGFVFSYSPETMQKLIDILRKTVPDMPVTIGNAVESLQRFRGVVGVLGLIGLVWSVSRIAYAIQTGFDQIWEMKKRSYVRKKIFALGVMLLIGVVGLIGLSITMLSTGFFSWLRDVTGPVISTLAVVLGAILSPLASAIIFATLYRTLPQKKPGWREIFWGALTAALLLDISEYGLGFYFTRISKAQAIYGSIGVVIGIVLWLYVVGMLIFIGAEMVRALQERRGVAGLREADGELLPEGAPVSAAVPPSDE